MMVGGLEKIGFLILVLENVLSFQYDGGRWMVIEQLGFLSSFLFFFFLVIEFFFRKRKRKYLIEIVYNT